MGEDELRRIREEKERLAAAADGSGSALPPQAPGMGLPTEVRIKYGDSFRPSPFGYTIDRWTVGGLDVVVYTFETVHGRNALMMSDVESREFIRAASEKTSGLILPGMN